MLSSYRFSLMWLIVFTAVILGKAHAREIALTFDDAPTPDSSWLTGHERTEKIIAALKENGVEHALFFVKADYINDDTAKRLKQYTEAGFQLAHHSFSHQSAEAIGVDAYMDDFEKAEQALKPFHNKLALHRFPYLRYGKNLDDINQLPPAMIERMKHYFLTYKLIPGEESKVSIGDPYGFDHARVVIQAAIDDYDTEYGGES